MLNTDAHLFFVVVSELSIGKSLNYPLLRYVR